MWNKQQCLLSLLSSMALMAFVGLALATTVVPHQAAFIQSGDQLRYFVDDEQAVFVTHLKNANSCVTPLFLMQDCSRDADDSRSPSAPRDDGLEFTPPSLDLGKRSFGAAHIETVRVRNPTRHAVRFDAISGTSHHFHASFFADKTIAPGAWTTFDVAFLPRAVANIHSTLYINSSLGHTAYEVRGSGVLSAHELVSHITARTCVNGSVLTPLSVTNPYASALHITEMYTSSASVHLELPSTAGGGTSGDALWHIPAHSTSTVMHARYMGAVERNTTTYIRIKARDEHGEGMQWVLPFDAHVTRRKGIYAVTPVLDFGIVRNAETSKTVDLHIAANTNKTVFITDISAESHEPAMRIVNPPKATAVVGEADDGRQWTASLDGKCASCPVLVARLNILGDHLLYGVNERVRHLSGKIVVEGRHKGGGKYRLVIPYKAVWYAGELLHEPGETCFHSGKEPPLVRNVTLRNTFDRPITIREVSLSKVARRFFASETVVPLPLVLYPHGGASVAFALKYHTKGPAAFVGTVRLQTNMSAFDIALHIFDGKLQFSLSSIEQDAFDFGTVEAGDARSILLTVANTNTVPVAIRQHRHAIQAYTSMRVVSTYMYNDTMGDWSSGHSWSSHMRHLHTAVNDYVAAADGGDVVSEWVAGQDVVIPASSVTVFEYTLVAPDSHVQRHAVHTFQTPYEEKSFAVLYKVEAGTVVSLPETITLPNAYPYRMSTAPLHVYSTYPRNMTVRRLGTLTHDARFVFETFDKQRVGVDPKRRAHVNAVDDLISPVVAPNAMSYLGRLFFVPHRTCPDECYVGTPLTEDEGKWFAYGMRLPANLAQIDGYVHSKLRQRWRRFAHPADESDTAHDSSAYVVRSHVVVDTDTVKNMRIPVEAQLVWPKIMTRHTVHFPLTAIVNLTMHNPSTRPVLVQLLPLTIYPDPELFLHYFDEHMPSVLSSNVEMNETLMFTLRDTELFPLRPDSPVPRLREEIEAVVNHQMPRFTLSMVLQPGMKVRVRVGFMPRDFEMRSSLIIIRNNLTGIEPVVLHGRGAKVEMLVDNHPSRHHHAISFDLGDNLLTDCATPPIRLTVRRVLTVWNTGQVHMHLTNLSVNGVPCVNRGYRILNCEPFKLRPNDTHELSIAYTPDFLLASGDAAIQLFAMHNSTPWTYHLGSVVSSAHLTECHLALERPRWESLLYWSCLVFMTLTFVCTWASAFLEGDRFVVLAYKHMKDMFDEERAHFTPFDLNRPPGKAPPLVKAEHHENVGVVPTVVKTLRWTLLRWLDAVLIRLRAALTEEENEARPPRPVPVVCQQPIAVVEPQPPVVLAPTVVALDKQPTDLPPLEVPQLDIPQSEPEVTQPSKRLAQKQHQQRRLDRQRHSDELRRQEESSEVENGVDKEKSEEAWEVIDRRPNKASKEKGRRSPPAVPPPSNGTMTSEPRCPTPPTLAPPPGLHAPVSLCVSSPSSASSLPEWDNDDDHLSVNDDAMDMMAEAAMHFGATEMTELGTAPPSRDVSVEKKVATSTPSTRTRRRSDRGKRSHAVPMCSPMPTMASRPLTAAQLLADKQLADKQLADKQQLAQRLYQQQLARQAPPAYGFMAPAMPPYRPPVPTADWPAEGAQTEWSAPPREGKATFKFNRDAPPFVAKTITPPMKPLAPIGRPVDDPSVLLAFPPRGLSPPPIDRAPLLDGDRSGWLSMSGGLFNLSNIWQPRLGLETTGEDWAEHGITVDDDDHHHDDVGRDDRGRDGEAMGDSDET